MFGEGALGFGVHIDQAPGGVDHLESVGDAIENIGDAAFGLAAHPRDLQACLDPRQQFARAERFDNVIVAARIHPSDVRFFSSAS